MLVRACSVFLDYAVLLYDPGGYKKRMCALAGGMLLVAPAAYAQAVRVSDIATHADEWAAKVADWRFMGQMSLGLTLGIAFLGLAVAALQLLKGRSWKVAAGVLSGVITFLTVVNSEVFDVGHRAYRRAATAAEPKVSEIRRWVQPLPEERTQRWRLSAACSSNSRRLKRESRRVRLARREPPPR